MPYIVSLPTDAALWRANGLRVERFSETNESKWEDEKKLLLLLLSQIQPLSHSKFLPSHASPSHENLVGLVVLHEVAASMGVMNSHTPSLQSSNIWPGLGFLDTHMFAIWLRQQWRTTSFLNFKFTLKRTKILLAMMIAFKSFKIRMPVDQHRLVSIF